MRDSFRVLTAVAALGAVGCGDTAAPPERYLASVQDLEVPAVAAASDSVRVRFTYSLRDCGGLEAIEIRQTFTGIEFAVWARPASTLVDCLAMEPPPVAVAYTLLPYSRDATFEVVVRQSEADLVRTIVLP